ncbi:addiction module antidote protein [Arenimonas alkanexedens]
MPLKTMPYDPAKYLDTDEAIAVFLMDAFESGHDGVFQNALQIAAKARGMTEVARTAGVGRESLYKALQDEAQPRFSTVTKVLGALGVELAIVARQKSPANMRTARRGTKLIPAAEVMAGLEAQLAAAKAKAKTKQA